MAAVSGRHPAQENSGEENTPAEFRAAVAALRATGVRPEVELADTPAPRKLAPYAFALEASVADEEGEELAGGRLVLLHQPDGHEAWDGRFRLVTLVRAELEPEMAHDPLLADVGWSWLMDALDQQGAQRTEPSGTVSRSSSHYFGALADRQASTEIEIRASWTPVGTDWAAHLRGWCELLCLCAGLPPTPPVPPSQQPGSVVPMPTRRRP